MLLPIPDLRARLRDLGVEPLLALAALPLFVVYQPYSWVGVVLLLLPWAWRAAHGQAPFQRTSLDWPVVLFLIGGLVGLWAAYDAAAGLARLYGIIGAVLMYYAVVNNRSSAFWERAFVLLLVVSGLVLGVYFMTQNDFSAGGKFPLIDQAGLWLAGLFPQLPWHRPHPNILASYLVMVLPLGLALAGAPGPADAPWARPGRFLGVVASVVIVTALVFTQSRGSWLALGAVVALWGLSHWRWGRWVAVAGVLAGVTGLILAVMTWDYANASRLAWLTSAVGAVSAGGQAINRLDLYRQMAGLAGDYAFTGLGLGGMPLVYAVYDLMVGKNPFLSHAHNLPLEVWLEQGLLGAVALVGMTATLFHSHVAKTSAAVPFLRRAALWGFAALLLQGIWDSGFYASRALPLFLIMPALAVDPWPETTDPGRVSPALRGPQRDWSRLRWGLAAVTVLGALSVARWAAPAVSGAWQANLGAVTQDRGELPDGLPDSVALAYRQEAMGLYESALAADSANSTAHRRLGEMLLRRGAYVPAAEHLEAARLHEPWNAAAAHLLATTYLALGQEDESYRLWQTLPDAVQRLSTEVWQFDQRQDREASLLARRVLARLQAEPR